jgi:5-methylcytosine-specific restriction protein A
MRFVRGNRAIRDHAADGKSLLLFEALNKSGEYRFIGPFTCANWENGSGRDRKGAIRETIIFHLIPDAASSAPALAPPANSTSSIEALRKRAYAAAVATSGSAGKEAKRIYYERSAAVRDYVLSRAAGTCECCKMPAPFTRKDGTLYLEPHHIRRVSDGGPDHPRWVGAICPACHREIHFGQNGQVKNDSLMRYLASIEETPL